MSKIIEGLEALSAEHGLGTGSLLVIRSDVRPPTEEAREYIKRELARSSMLAAAQVVEGTGFRGSAMRSALTMLQLAARPRYPMKVFAEVEAAAIWLANELLKRAGDAPGGVALSRAVNDVRSRFLIGGSESMSLQTAR